MDFSNLKGSIVAIVTPFNDDSTVDFETLGKLIEWHIASGTDAILTLGTTGETSTMTQEEDNRVCKFMVDKVAKRVPVIAGAGSNSTQEMLERSLIFEKLGADALLIISPYYIKTNEEGMYRHFVTVADAVSIPCILYNVPGRTGCNISEAIVERLSKHPNICGIKEASGNMSYTMKIARYINDDFALFSGDDDLTVPMLSLGASGVMSVAANVVPSEIHGMVKDYLSGETQRALQTQLRLLSLINNLFTEVNPIPVKAALGMMGKCNEKMRLPLFPMSQGARDNLMCVMRDLEII